MGDGGGGGGDGVLLCAPKTVEGGENSIIIQFFNVNLRKNDCCEKI